MADARADLALLRPEIALGQRLGAGQLDLEEAHLSAGPVTGLAGSGERSVWPATAGCPGPGGGPDGGRRAEPGVHPGGLPQAAAVPRWPSRCGSMEQLFLPVVTNRRHRVPTRPLRRRCAPVCRLGGIPPPWSAPKSLLRCGFRAAGRRRSHVPSTLGAKSTPRVARLEADLGRPWWRRWLSG